MDPRNHHWYPLENRLDIIVVLPPEIMETFLLHVFAIITISG